MSRKFVYTFRMPIKHSRDHQFACIACRCAHHKMQHILTSVSGRDARHQTLQRSRRYICPRRLQPLRQLLDVGAQLLVAELLLENFPQVLQHIQVRRAPLSHLLLPQCWQNVSAPFLGLLGGLCGSPILHEIGLFGAIFLFSIVPFLDKRRSAGSVCQFSQCRLSVCQDLVDMIIIDESLSL